jgi:flavin reductase (DIM6/NTAB) family NADH-FMN oxidoreductase RutF
MERFWREIRPEDLDDNVFELAGKQWMLVSAGRPGAFNTMTASWGCFGVLWQKPVAVCFVRPTRHTFGFINKAEHYTLSVLPEDWRKALEVCGSRSGRDTDKIAVTGLLPVDIEGKAVSFEQARLVFLCRKLYAQDFDPKLFLDPEIETLYPQKDYHRVFIGEVERVLRKEAEAP